MLTRTRARTHTHKHIRCTNTETRTYSRMHECTSARNLSRYRIKSQVWTVSWCVMSQQQPCGAIADRYAAAKLNSRPAPPTPSFPSATPPPLPLGRLAPLSSTLQPIATSAGPNQLTNRVCLALAFSETDAGCFSPQILRERRRKQAVPVELILLPFSLPPPFPQPHPFVKRRTAYLVLPAVKLQV